MGIGIACDDGYTDIGLYRHMIQNNGISVSGLKGIIHLNKR
jgi:hypothetical protein